MSLRRDEGTEVEGVVTRVETRGGEVYTVESGGDTLFVYQSYLEGGRGRFFNRGDRVRFWLLRGRVYRMEIR